MDTLLIPALLAAIPLGALMLILRQRYRRPGRLPEGEPLCLVGRIDGPGNPGDRACGLGDDEASRFTLLTRDEYVTVLSQGAILRPGPFRLRPELRVGDLVTLYAVPTTRERRRGAYREPAREPVVDAVRVVRGSWKRARWAALPLGLVAAVAAFGAYKNFGPWTVPARAAASLACPAETDIRSAPAAPSGWAMWCQHKVTGKRHGSWGLFYATGKTWIRGQYTKGLVTGTWTEYYPDGHIKARGELADPWWAGRQALHFWQAVKHGKWSYHYPDGSEWVKGKYWEGERHDAWSVVNQKGWLSWEGRYSRRGELLSATLWDGPQGPAGVAVEKLGQRAPADGLGKMTAPGSGEAAAPSLMWGYPCLETNQVLACSLRSLR